MAVNVLLSYAYHAKTNLAAFRKDQICGRLLIDSGAFTAYTTGKQISLTEYAEFLTTWQGSWDHAVTLDVIGDPVATRKQTIKMHGMGLPVMPVFTRGDTIAEFDAMVKDSGYVCVGGLVGLPGPQMERRITLLQRRAQEHGGGIHALGVGSVSTLARAKPYSADASSISGSFRFGTVMVFADGRIINVPVTDRAKLLKHREAMLSHDMDVNWLATNRKMPAGKTGRPALLKAMSLSYVAADEFLHRRGVAPVPHGIVDNPGTHLYSSLNDGIEFGMVARLDRELHEGYSPRVWRQYGSHHTCHPRRAASAAV